jgi:mannose-6-phosphate isomerase-like protein (cupin superfamily)
MQFFPNLLAKAGGNSFTRTALPLDEPARRHLSLVVATIPANAAFPLHMHPKSEDAFVVISGSGHLVGSEGTRSISGLDAVWVPPGNAHGLTTGHEGILEIGCQVPPDELPIEVPAGRYTPSHREAVVASIKPPGRISSGPSWSTVFPASHEQALRLFSASLSRSDELLPPPGASASVIIVVRGAAQFGAHTLRALGVAVYAHESQASIRAQENDTLLVSLLAFPECHAIRPPSNASEPTAAPAGELP